ncbi:amino acid permease [Naasia lichenicola]|uniref:Amino acid permease n=1 Tax=Naasia lichenicola TaxID=2565933 RepID=A0A4S4FNN7_9MICO|nr:amino acid permease [Naasia lichenicola]THG31848.1 amino acid permease [Naasia lichenicola]
MTKTSPSGSTTGGSSGATYTAAEAGYFEKRTLKRTAGFWGLMGIGIAAVISGDFSGWNPGLGQAGWGGLFIATLIIIVMYFGMLFSIGEMSAAMPHTGGAYSFARAALGPWGGFVTGLAETIEYVVTTAVVVLFSAYYLDAITLSLINFTLAPADGPNLMWIWWVVLYAVFVGLNSLGAQASFRFALIVAIISAAVLVVFAVLAIANGAVDFGRLLNIEPEAGNSQFLPFGFAGILFALPFATWFFLGIEELPLAAEEAHNPQKDIPKAGIWGIITLAFFALLVLFLNPAVTGSAEIAASGEPLLDGFRAFLPEDVAAVLSLFALIGLLASLQGIMFAAGRNMYSLSRAGYYPKFLSLTGRKHQTPWVALIAGAVIGFIVLLLVQAIASTSDSASAAANGIILFIAVFGAVISYCSQMLSFVVLRRRFPNAVRPYKSPVGIPGAVVAGVIAFITLLGIVFVEDFRPAIITGLIVFAAGIIVFAVYGRHRLVLSPEEEYALSGGLHRDPAVEDYDHPAPPQP